MKFFYSLFLLLAFALTGKAQKYIYGGQRDSMRPIAANGKAVIPAAKTAEVEMLKKKDSLYKLQQDSVAYAIDSAAKADTVTATMKLYREQTGNEQFAKSDKGAAVFFNMPMATRNDFYYGFFDNASKGTILKVHNPGTDKTVYVKVLGPLPKTKQYYNCILGISNKAKEALGSVEDKMWCDVSYASGW